MTIDEVIERWSGLPGGAERKNFAPFLYDLIDALGLPRPGPGVAGRLGDYEFEGTVQGGSAKQTGAGGSADLYKRGCFVMEAKQSYLPPRDQRAPGLFDGADVIPLAPNGAAYDKLMIRAQAQAKNYAHNLPADHPSVPFLIVCDVGRAFELYYDAAGNGRGYGFYPDAKGYRIPLARLRDADVQALLRDIWTNPAARDPKLIAADVTKKVTTRLAAVSQWLEATQRIKTKDLSTREQSLAVEQTALFVMRLLFCMFAEDIGLLPERRFTEFLEAHAERDDDRGFNNGLADLWTKMNSASGNRFAFAVEDDVRYFNGGLFEEAATYTLSRAERGELLAAARHNWRNVEPAIFGTLLEQALSTRERATLGAHYTPRAYVERLVDATIMEVLNAEWAAVQEQLTEPGIELDASRAIAAAFHDRLARVTVLDPACGTGNFLYVAMEAIERLEAQVIEVRRQLGDDTAARVAPHQFLGLEKNPRAAKIAELVLWIGWLRFRIDNDPDSITDPVLRSAANINFGRHGEYDAVLDEATGLIPDWPEAEFIIGNPPFIGKGQKQRQLLGDDYLKAMHKANIRVPRSGNYFLQWWDRAAAFVADPDKITKRFGLVTSNTISQPFNRKLLRQYLHSEEQPLSIILAVPDHHWTRGQDGADVRIAMTVIAAGVREGRLVKVVSESGTNTDDPNIQYEVSFGKITEKLTLDGDLLNCSVLKANDIASNGVLLAGRGFVLTQNEMRHIASLQKTENSLRPYLAGAELMQARKNRFVIDFSGLTEAAARTDAPAAYQHLLDTVRKARMKVIEDETAADAKAYAESWWLFAKQRQALRQAIVPLDRFIATTETAKFRVFQFVDSSVVVDHMIVGIASKEAFHLGVLSSDIHKAWTYANCGMMGVAKLDEGHRYTKSQIFDRFPFPDPSPTQRAAIADIAEELDRTRKQAIAEVAGLTMTELYNLRALWVAGTLTPAQRDRAVAARAGIVAKLHDDLDAAVAAAYGWADAHRAGALTPAEIVTRLVALNAERAAEEKAGTIRWLRPDYQQARFGKAAGDQAA